jgi:hypothetical protein
MTTMKAARSAKLERWGTSTAPIIAGEDAIPYAEKISITAWRLSGDDQYRPARYPRRRTLIPTQLAAPSSNQTMIIDGSGTATPGAEEREMSRTIGVKPEIAPV